MAPRRSVVVNKDKDGGSWGGGNTPAPRVLHPNRGKDCEPLSVPN
jgi:hypothetical protein